MKTMLGAPGLAITLAVAGCEISVGGGDDDDVDIDAGLSWSWSLHDYDTEAAIDCAAAGAAYTRLTVEDSQGTVHEIYWLCGDLEGETDGWEIATGTASITADLVTSQGVVLSGTSFEFDLESGQLSNDLGEVAFYVEVWDPAVAADASIAWEWVFGEDYDGGWYPDAGDCAEAGIDYVNVWVWNPVWEAWWTDAAFTEFPCHAIDHAGDPWDDLEWSGLWIQDFLGAGGYQLFLGFYQEAGYGEDGGTTDLLLWYDTRGTLSSPFALEADEDSAEGYNDLGATVLDPAALIFGVLKVNLKWGQSEGGTSDSCADSEVDTMGFLLRNDGWVAAEVPLEDGVECLDWLVFEEVPVLDEAYELLVSGMNAKSQFLWYNLCTGLDPETGVDAESAAGYTCVIENALAQ
jgi:hypothetical protein